MDNLRVEELLDDLRLAYDGDAWHSIPLRRMLQGVTAEVAIVRPIASAHSIWGMVTHLAACDGVVADRIKERSSIETPERGDFPEVAVFGPEAWAETLRELDRQHARLTEVLSGLGDGQFDEFVLERSARRLT